MSEVQFRDIPGFPGYRVGDDGWVWSCRKHPGHGVDLRKKVPWIHTNTWKQLKAAKTSTGYRGVTLFPGGRTHKVCRLVLLAFVGPAPKGMVCCHGDGNQENDHLGNLRWGTYQSNEADKRKHGTVCEGRKHHAAKLTESDVRQIRKRYAAGGITTYKLAAEYKVSRTLIGFIINRKWWKHI